MLEVREGDFLITNQPGMGIAVLTADCLPIIFYVPQHNFVAAAHARWRASIAGIGIKVLENFNQQYNLDLSQVQVYFGPAARSCNKTFWTTYHLMHTILLFIEITSIFLITHSSTNKN